MSDFVILNGAVMFMYRLKRQNKSPHLKKLRDRVLFLRHIFPLGYNAH